MTLWSAPTISTRFAFDTTTTEPSAFISTPAPVKCLIRTLSPPGVSSNSKECPLGVSFAWLNGYIDGACNGTSKFTPNVLPPIHRPFTFTPRAAELTELPNQLSLRGYSPVGSAVPSVGIPIVYSSATPFTSLSLSV